MTTARQVAQALAPLVARHPDVKLVGKMLVVLPVHHLLRAIFIDRTSSEEICRPVWFVMDLFSGGGFLNLTYGSDAVPPRFHRPGDGLWNWNEPEMADLLVDAIEGVLPLLRQVTTIGDYIEFQKQICRYKQWSESSIFWNSAETRLIVLAAQGDFGAIPRDLKDSMARYDLPRWRKPRPGDVERVEFVKQVLDFVSTDNRQGLADLLAAKETANIEQLRLSKIWQPTPFPVETTSTIPSLPPLIIDAGRQGNERTAADVCGPLLERHNDLSVIGRLIVVRPVEHILRAIVLDETNDADVFRPVWFCTLTFDLEERLNLRCGGYRLLPRLYAPPFGPWRWSDPQTPARLADAIELVIPRLRAVRSVADFVGLELERQLAKRSLMRLFDEDLGRRILVSAALGDFDGIPSFIDPQVQNLKPHWERPPSELHREAVTYIKAVYSHVRANDRAGVAKLLHQGERRRVELLKIEHLWEPTPFPLEDDSSA